MYACAIDEGRLHCGTETLIALFRLWHGRRIDGANPLPSMAEAAAEHGATTSFGPDHAAQLAVACDSFFALTEACLGRSLKGGSDGARYSADEEALITTLRQVPVLEAMGPNPVLPHGLPGALQWAAFAVLRWLDVGPDTIGEMPSPATCPYAAKS